MTSVPLLLLSLLCGELLRSRRLNQAAQQAGDNMADALAECIEGGMKYDQAWEAVKENWTFLASEEDQPKLDENACKM